MANAAQLLYETLPHQHLDGVGAEVDDLDLGVLFEEAEDSFPGKLPGRAAQARKIASFEADIRFGCLGLYWSHKIVLHFLRLHSTCLSVSVCLGLEFK